MVSGLQTTKVQICSMPEHRDEEMQRRDAR